LSCSPHVLSISSGSVSYQKHFLFLRCAPEQSVNEMESCDVT
jgi:hypothetical protein